MVLSRMSSMEYIFKRKLNSLIIICLSALCSPLSSQSGPEIIGLVLKGEYQKAREGLEQIQKAGSESRDTVLFLQGLLAMDGEAAAETYQKLLTEFPESKYCDDAMFRLAQLAYARGAYRSALSRFREIQTSHPNSNLIPACLQWQNLCLQAMGESDDKTEDTVPSSVTEPGLNEILGVIENDIVNKPVVTPVKPSGPKTSPAYAVQVNAFSEQSRALMQKSFFEKNGYLVSLGSKTKDNQTLYLVWVGSVSTKEEALALKNEISNKFGVSGFVVTTQ